MTSQERSRLIEDFVRGLLDSGMNDEEIEQKLTYLLALADQIQAGKAYPQTAS